MFAGGFTAALVLWVVRIGVGFVPAMPVENESSLWLPWRIDGAWALAGAIGWGYLACRLTGGYVSRSLVRRGFEKPSAEWVVLAVAISGYVGLALGRNLGAQIFYAVAIGAVTLRTLAFGADGHARRWRRRPKRRTEQALVAVALLLAVAYGVTHAFAVSGSGGTFGTPPVQMRVGGAQTMDIGLSRMGLPVSIQSVLATGPGSAAVRIRSTVLNLDNPQELPDGWMLHHLSPAQLRGLPTSSTRLPFHVPADRSLWISLRVSLRSCGTATLDTLRLRYTVAGITTSATIPITTPLTLVCSR